MFYMKLNKIGEFCLYGIKNYFLSIVKFVKGLIVFLICDKFLVMGGKVVLFFDVVVGVF